MSTEVEPALKVSAHVLVQLGTELVTDAEQAILECVKNAYDADSPGCRIEIETREIGEVIEQGAASKLLRFHEPAESVSVAIFAMNGDRLDLMRGSERKVDPREVVSRHLHYTGRITIEDHGDGLSPRKITDSWLVVSRSAKRETNKGPKKKTAKNRTPLGDKGLGRLGSMKLGDILVVESATSSKAPPD